MLTTTPSAPAPDEATSPWPVPPRPALQTLLVPVFTALGPVCAWYAKVADGHRMDQSVPCTAVRTPTPLTEYVAAWAGLGLGAAAVVLCVLAAKGVRRRCGRGLWSTRRGLLAYVSVWFNVVAIPFALLIVLMAYRPAAVWGGGDCG
ncbi:hypothetical protein [Streptomyces sp. NPDC049555]|uniref:hypothetical protein n=1 Tax=unclassified Streptomyces TaxID=2593676 RepID=UPI003422927F